MQTNFLSTFSDIVQIISSIFVVIAGIIAIWQYCLNVKNTKSAIQKDIELRQTEIYQKDREKIIHAIELAGYYKDNILPLARELKFVYRTSGIYDIMQTIDINSMENFDTVELDKNLSLSQIQDIKSLGAKYSLGTVLRDKGIYNLSEDLNAPNDLKNTESFENISSKQNEASAKKNSPNNALTLITLLNNLEYFSMHFIHNTADHTVVYQSLHMTFLEIVRMLYYDISSVNINGERKFYINVILLFNKWNPIAKEQRDREIKSMRTASNIGNILQDYK